MSDKELVKQFISELNDQKDFLALLYKQLEELYGLKNSTTTSEFEFGFHFGDTYRLFNQYKEDSNRLGLEIANFLASKTFDIDTPDETTDK